MRSLLLATIASLSASAAATAATVDLSDNSFDQVEYQFFFSSGFTGPIVGFDEVADGVTFSFATSGQFRQVGTWGNGTSNTSGPFALQFGGSGGNPAVFSLSVSHDITLDSFTGLAQLGNTNPLFDVSGTGVSSAGNTFSTVGSLTSTTPTDHNFVSGPLSLTAGATYLFSTTNSAGFATTGFFTSLNFTAAAVPLPAGLPLMLAGLGAFGFMRRRKVQS